MVSDGIKSSRVLFNYMTILELKNSMKKYKLGDDAMKEIESKKSTISLYPKCSKTTLDTRLVKVGSGQMGGTHWTYFYLKDFKSFFFDFFGGPNDKFLFHQLPKSLALHNYEKSRYK